MPCRRSGHQGRIFFNFRFCNSNKQVSGKHADWLICQKASRGLSTETDRYYEVTEDGIEEIRPYNKA